MFDRLEIQLKQLLRTAEIEEGLRVSRAVSATANLLVAVVTGRMMQYVQSGFERLPNTHWEDQWAILADTITIDSPKG